jgi:diphthamide biosynthesis protein 2
MFVLISCSQNSLIDSKDFIKPIITPFELELAFKKGKSFDGNFQLNYNNVLKNKDIVEKNENLNEVEEEDGVRYSFISQKIISNNVSDEKDLNFENDKSLVVKNNDQLALLNSENSSLSILNNKKFKGLDLNDNEFINDNIGEGFLFF